MKNSNERKKWQLSKKLRGETGGEAPVLCRAPSLIAGICNANLNARAVFVFGTIRSSCLRLNMAFYAPNGRYEGSVFRLGEVRGRTEMDGTHRQASTSHFSLKCVVIQ